MKVLLIHDDTSKKDKEVSAVHIWRIIRPFQELAKHVDWQIDHQSHLIDISKLTTEDKLTEKELLKQAEKIGQYDIVWSSYYTDSSMFALSQVVGKKYGTKFVIDDDDDIYNIADTNPFWLKMTKEDQWLMQRMIEEAPYIVTTNKRLQKHYKKKSFVDSKIYVLPNYISGYKHNYFDNGLEVVITFFGGSAHTPDLENTGVMEALQQIMNKYKNVRVHFIGCKAKGYLPTGRFKFDYGKVGYDWLTDIWPNINADISIAPLEDTEFNRNKTPIKWMESAMIPAAFIGSNIPPFTDVVEQGKTGLLVNNTTEDWYEAIEKLVTDRNYRNELKANASKEVQKHTLENNWQKLKDLVEEIVADKSAKYDW